MNYDVIIIGGGIIGFSTAWQLKQSEPHLNIAVLEKENSSATHQTGHNSGVIHAGVYYEPGSLKAEFCVKGCKEIKTFCEEHDIAYKVLGKIIASTNDIELERMQVLKNRCMKNGLTVTNLTEEEAKKYQPGMQCNGAFLVEETGIVDWKAVCKKYAELFIKLGGRVFYNQKVTKIKENTKDIEIQTQKGDRYKTAYVIAAAGLHADRIVRLTGKKPDFKIVPFRGEYYRLNSSYDNYFNHLIYPVPDPSLPFLGVHFTPQTKGFTTIGPSAVLALAREGYNWLTINPRDCLEVAFYKPFWKIIKKHYKATWKELQSSILPRYYLKQIQTYFPHISMQDISRYPAGVRAQAVDKEGNLMKDFYFENSERILHVCNAPSPAATSSLPIGRYVVDKFYNVLRK